MTPRPPPATPDKTIVRTIKHANTKKIFIGHRTGGNITLNNIGQDKSVYLFKIEQCDVIIIGKINNIYIEKSRDITIKCDTIINTFDAFNCGYVKLENSNGSMNTILSEQVECLDMEIDNAEDCYYIVSSTYNVKCYSKIPQKTLGVHFSMFSDRFETVFGKDFKPKTTRLETKPNLLITY